MVPIGADWGWIPSLGTGWSVLLPMAEGGASVATGWKIFCEVIPGSTELVGEVTGAVSEIVVLGAEIEVLIRGAEVGTPVVFRLVMTVPDVFGFVVLSVGRI